MATDIVSGLFGINPAALQRARQEAAFAEDYKSVQLSPIQQGNLMLRQGARALGEGLAPLLGGQDPEMAKATLARQLASQFDITSAEGLRQYASALAQNGAPDLAQLAIQRADQLTTAGLTQSELQTRSIRNIAAANRERMPEIAQLQEYRDRLVAELGADHPKVKEVDETIKGVAKGRSTNITLPGEAQDKIIREKRTLKFLDLEDKAIDATNTIQLARSFNNVLSSAFTGIGSSAKLTAGQVANALGVTVTGTTESEQLDQLLAALTLGQAKNLKGALSDKDLKFLKEAVGTRGLTRATLQSVVDQIERNALIDEKTFDLASKYEGDMAKLNINTLRKQATQEVNDFFTKRKRYNELKQKAGQPTQ